MSDVSQDPGLGPDVRRPTVDARAVTGSPESRGTQFVAVSGPGQENTSATTMLVTAYSLFWLLLLGFVWMTWRRQQQLTSRLQHLESQLAKLHAGDLK
jgi:hypothetical protein